MDCRLVALLIDPVLPTDGAWSRLSRKDTSACAEAGWTSESALGLRNDTGGLRGSRVGFCALDRLLPRLKALSALPGLSFLARTSRKLGGSAMGPTTPALPNLLGLPAGCGPLELQKVPDCTGLAGIACIPSRA